MSHSRRLLLFLLFISLRGRDHDDGAALGNAGCGGKGWVAGWALATGMSPRTLPLLKLRKVVLFILHRGMLLLQDQLPPPNACGRIVLEQLALLPAPPRRGYMETHVFDEQRSQAFLGDVRRGGAVARLA